MRDTGLICHLMGISSPIALAGHPSFGNIFESWAVCWIARMAEAIQAPPQFYHWRTNGGAEVDLVLQRATIRRYALLDWKVKKFQLRFIYKSTRIST